MNWEAIGAVAELAGAIGVIVSLIYLARQISMTNENVAQNTTALFTLVYLARQLRESNTLARSASVHEVMSAYGYMNEMILTNPKIADLLARLDERGGEFSQAEIFQLEAYCEEDQYLCAS